MKNFLTTVLLSLAIAAGMLYLMGRFNLVQSPARSPQVSEAESPAAQTPDENPPAPGESLAPSSLYAQNNSPARMSTLDSLERGIDSGRRTAIVDASARLAPSVVSVNVLQTQVVQAPVRDWFGYFYVPRERTVQGIGSGFIINSRGYILTNNHVIKDGTRITVSTNDGTEYDAEVLGTDPGSDVALLKIDPGDDHLTAAQLGDSDDLLLGEWAIAIGSPFGLLLDDPQPTVTVGVISAIGRDIVRDQGSGDQVYANMIQTDAAINPGNSGGPLANAMGEVIGINTFIFSPSGGSVGMGFAIPINRAVRISEDLIRGGKVRHPWLGIKVQPLTPDLHRGLGFGENQRLTGVVVSNVQPLSPAEKSGHLRSGDLITAIGGESIRSVDDWTGKQLDIRVGSPVELRVHRPGGDFNVTVTPAELPTETQPKVDTGLGFELIDLSPEVRSQLEARSQQGAVVVTISDASLENAGSLLRYDILYQINNIQVQSAKQAVELMNRLRGSRGAVLYLERDGRGIRRYLTR
jgi:serine protease Do